MQSVADIARTGTGALAVLPGLPRITTRPSSGRPDAACPVRRRGRKPLQKIRAIASDPLAAE